MNRQIAVPFLIGLALLASSPAAAQPAQPEPIVIARTGGPPTIPDVPRDQVIGFALYTVNEGVLKLTAQFYPLQAGESRTARLELQRGAEWESSRVVTINEDSWTAHFRVEDWDQSRDVRYRVTHEGGAVYEGLIRRNPDEKDEIVVAAFTGNSNTDRGPREDIIRNLKHQDPDLLFFSGDQVYDHHDHLAAWLLFGRQFGEIIRDRPTITIPDDHDVGQGNLWGENGKVAKLEGGADGGYVKPPDYVNQVQRAQTSHLPDPVDPTPVGQGIGVYYTALQLGGIDFAIIEDRKWKTGPAGLIPQQGPRPDHVNDPAYDPDAIDVPEARLLGDRQLKFLREWGQDWSGVEMKVVLSQTIFAGGAHIHGQHDQRLVADLDSNGWPQQGRARALAEMRRFFGFHIAGDQHLATIIHHGINDWEDSGVSFGVPSIVNYYGRWWWPTVGGLNRDPGNPLPFSGRHRDGFGNKITMHAYANPAPGNYNAAGYGLVRFRKSTREITMECWPRHVDVTASSAEQFPGWPRTVSQEDNYGRKAIAYLPWLELTGIEDPVVQIVDEFSGEVVYTLRIKGTRWRPKVFREGFYTVLVMGRQTRKSLSHIHSVEEGSPETLRVSF